MQRFLINNCHNNVNRFYKRNLNKTIVKFHILFSNLLNDNLMKHKIFFYSSILSISFFFIASCKKDPTKNAKLPPITQEGKNTIGFTINGEVWVPYYKCRFMGDPCGEIHASYGEAGGAASNGIGFSFSRMRNGKMSSLIFSSAFASITSTGEKIDSIGITFLSEEMSNDGYFIGPISGSKFTVTKIDFQNQIISGQFEFILRERKNDGTVTDNIIKLTDGRFDFKFNACRCSN